MMFLVLFLYSFAVISLLNISNYLFLVEGYYGRNLFYFLMLLM